jgi:uncharacterized membrane protein (UPF0127 family)
MAVIRRSGSQPQTVRWQLRLVALIACVLYNGCSTKPAVIFSTSSGEKVSVRAELASTPETRARGLMFRKNLAQGEGMLFLFPEEEILTFWMKNTLIPLDVIFISSKMVVVGTIEKTVPLSTNPLSISAPAKFVLEVVGGFAQKKGIAVGARVEFKGVKFR